MNTKNFFSDNGRVYAFATSPGALHEPLRSLFQLDSNDSFDRKQMTTNNLAQASFSATFLQGKLYVVGGKFWAAPQSTTDFEISKMVRVFDPDQNT